MKIFAISDLHLSGNNPKPMDVFGSNWQDHFQKIRADWAAKVSDDDVVLIAGDISWAISFEDGLNDLKAFADLKGKKVLIRGNHDYWWSGIGKLRDSAPENFIFLQNDAVKIDDLIICGSRGWVCPGSSEYTERDNKLYLREAERFKLCFKSANTLRTGGEKLLAMIHYPPFNVKHEPTLFTEMFEQNKVDKVVFGHLHGNSYFPDSLRLNGVDYYLTSCDKIDFKLIEINLN